MELTVAKMLHDLNVDFDVTPSVLEHRIHMIEEQAELAPIVEAYKQYKQAKQDVEDSLAILEDESDEEMRELAKEELSDARRKIEELEKELKILLLPKDPNDDKNIIMEIRAGAAETRRRCSPPSCTACT